MKIVLAIVLSLLTSAAFAQAPQPASVVQQLMANDANIKAALAEQLDKANAKLSSDEAEIKRLKDKYEPTKAPEPKK